MVWQVIEERKAIDRIFGRSVLPIKKKKRNQVNSKNYWELKKRLCVRLLKVINTSWENLHIASKAHISMAFAPFTRLICASRSADFLRWCLSPWSTRPWPKRLAKVNFKATSSIPPPLIWLLAIFDFFASWYRKRNLVWKPHKKIQREVGQICDQSWELAFFLYKVVHQIGCLRIFSRARGNEFKSVTALNNHMKLGTLAYHVHGYKMLLQIF